MVWEKIKYIVYIGRAGFCHYGEREIGKVCVCISEAGWCCGAPAH